MFDIGFWEMILIGVIALLVVGPARLPRVARMAGLWLGRARRTLTSVKAEIDRELKAQELREILEKQDRSNPLETILEGEHAKAKPPERAPTPPGARAATDDKQDPSAG